MRILPKRFIIVRIMHALIFYMQKSKYKKIKKIKK
jgi:hypothetical protein